MTLALLQKRIRETTVSASDEHDLLSLATMGHVAIAAALHLWEQTAPTDLKGMLIGEQGWRWDRTIQGYRNVGGRIVTGVELKELAFAVAEALKKKSKSAIILLLLGQIQSGPWRHEFASDVSSLYTLLAALAVGGFFYLTPAIKKMVAGHPTRPPGLLYTLGRLRRFTGQLETIKDNPPASTLGLQERAGMYIDSGQTIFEEARRQSYQEEAKRTGKLLESRNILGPADHCVTRDGTIGCVECTEMGWMPVEAIPAPGLRTCVTNCKCHLEFRLVEA